MDILVEEFLNFLSVEKGASPNTIDAYKLDINKFMEFIGKRGRSSLERVKRDDITAFLVSEKQRGLSASSVARSLAGLERMGEKSAGNLISAIEKSKKNPLRRLIFALGIRNVGVNAARILADRYESLSNLMKASVADLEEIHEIGPIMAESIAAFFDNKENVKVIEKIKAAGVSTRAARAAGDLAGKTFVLTGGLEGFTRQEATALIESRSGKVSSSVGKETDYVVVGKYPGSKYDKAKTLGVKTIDEKEFKKLLK